MLPLIEMMLKSQNGDAFSQIQKQFDLNPAQTEKALEAVMPAFSTGLKRNAAKPRDFGAFMQTLSGGRHEKYAEDTKAAFSREGVREGNGILGHLFGSKDVSRAVANQAAESSGVDEGIIKKMLPVVATMVMGGMFKQSTGQMQNFGDTRSSGGGGILGQILGELVKGGIGNQSTKQRQNRNQPRGRQEKNNPLGDILEQMLGGATAGRQRNTPQDNRQSGDNPLGQIFEELLGSKRDTYQPREEPRKQTRRRRQTTRAEPEFYEPEGGFDDIGSADRYNQPAPRNDRLTRNRSGQRNAPRNQAPQRRGGGLEDLFGDMFETGRKVDDGYQGGIEAIFDKLMKR